MMKTDRPRNTSGFTLIEVLVVITIIVILVAIAVPVLGSVRKKASSVHSISNLRQIASSMGMYANDHANRLPGPVWSGQAPYFFVANPGSDYVNGHLGHQLREYLPIQYPSNNQGYSKMFEYPEWKAQARDTSGPSYGVVRAVKVNGRWYKPLGEKRPGGSNDVRETMTTSQLTSLKIGRRIWIYEMDGETVSGSPGWKQKLPPEPVHGLSRNAMYFDFSVRPVRENDFELN